MFESGWVNYLDSMGCSADYAVSVAKEVKSMKYEFIKKNIDENAENAALYG